VPKKPDKIKEIPASVKIDPMSLLDPSKLFIAFVDPSRETLDRDENK
jgi:hypothetical protein